MHSCDCVPVCSIITLSLHVSEANIRRPHIRQPKRTRTCAKTHTPDASGARSLIHLPNEPGPTCMTRGLGSGSDAVASWPQGPRGDNNWRWKNPGIWVVGSRLGGLGVLRLAGTGPLSSCAASEGILIVCQALFKIFSLRKVKHLVYISIVARP